MPNYFSSDGLDEQECSEGTVVRVCGHCDGIPKFLRHFLYKHPVDKIYYSLPRFELCKSCDGKGCIEEEIDAQLEHEARLDFESELKHDK